MEILTGDGRVVSWPGPTTSTPSCSRPFPTRTARSAMPCACVIDLEPVLAVRAAARTCAYSTAEACLAAMADVCADWAYQRRAGQFVDGTVFGRDEHYITLGTFVDTRRPVSDYTGMEIYYRSMQRQAGGPSDRAGLPVALGHRLVLVLAGLRRAASAGAAAVAAPVPALRCVPPAGRVRPAPPAQRRG